MCDHSVIPRRFLIKLGLSAVSPVMFLFFGSDRGVTSYARIIVACLVNKGLGFSSLPPHKTQLLLDHGHVIVALNCSQILTLCR